MQVYPQYLNPSSQDLVETSSVLRVQHLEMALQKAVEDISLLQSNLAFVIKVKEDLQAQLVVKERREQAILKEYEKEMIKKERQIQELRASQQQLAQLLTDTKRSLELGDQSARQREDEIRNMQRILEEQRNKMREMDEELSAARYSSDLSYQSFSQDTMKVQQVERQNDELRYQLQKIKSQLQKESVRARKLQKQRQSFKTWLAQAVGVRKVVEGCENMLMEEITNRLSNCIQH